MPALYDEQFDSFWCTWEDLDRPVVSYAGYGVEPDKREKPGLRGCTLDKNPLRHAREAAPRNGGR
jgi:hypothetical protein